MMKLRLHARSRIAALSAALLLGGFIVPPIEAAEAPADQAEAQTTRDGDAKSQSADQSKAPESSGATPEIFVPTEEISEDFAVSFPVDI